MAEATNELIYEVLKTIQRDVAATRNGVRDLKSEMGAVRSHLTAIQKDTGNIYNRLGHLEDRMDRIDIRLGLAEPAH